MFKKPKIIIHSFIRKTACLGFFFYASPNFIFANTYDSIVYNLNPCPQKAILHVKMVIDGTFNDQVVVDLPSQWARASYTSQIKNVQAHGKHPITLEKQNNPLKAVINTNKSLTITYDIHQKKGNPSNACEAIIRHDLVHAPGHGIFATPVDLKEHEKIKVRINWLDLHSQWKTISSHGTEHCINRHLTMPELLHAVYVAGEIRMYPIQRDAHPVFLSLYGQFDVKDEKIVSDLKQIIHSQRKFFDDDDFAYYAISIIEGDEPNAMGGTRLTNSFSAFLPKTMKNMDFYALFAHEHVHNWIGGKIRNNEDEELNYWWSEGFTDFYSRLIAVRSRGIDLKHFIAQVNEFLRLYYLSPVNQEPNLRIKKDFWNNDLIQKLPYYRGFVFAIYLNDLIQQQKPQCSLDHVTHDLFRLCQKQKFSSSLFKEIVGRYVANGIAKEMEDFIDKGHIISIKNLHLPIEKVSLKPYYLGFDRDFFLKDQVIHNIDPNSNGYKVGLRNGQKIVRYDTTSCMGDPNQTITIHTTDKVFAFKPQHCYKKNVVCQIKPNLSPQETKQVKKFFGIKP